MQAYGHAAVVIIMFMVRGGLESCLTTVNYTGKVWDLWPALEYYLLCKDGNLQNHINVGFLAPWSPEILCYFLALGAKERILVCPTLVSDQGLRKMCSPGVAELWFGHELCMLPAGYLQHIVPQQALNPVPQNYQLAKASPYQIILPEGSLPHL